MQRNIIARLAISLTLWCFGFTLFGQELQVKERGLHHRVVETFSQSVDEAGQSVIVTNQFTELVNGMHYWDDDQWKETEEVIEIVGNGAAARKGPHKVIFSPNINTPGAIDLETPDGQRFRSQIFGLSYLDTATGQSVLIAELKDSIGELVGNNQVIYPDAFTDFQADVRFTYTRAGFEQDIILRQNPPSPSEYGLNPETTQLQVLTEFFDPPQPANRVNGEIPERLPLSDSLMDESLDFGAVVIGRGKAFGLETDSTVILPAQRETGYPVGKQWDTLEGRYFLIESVEIPTIAPELQQLPAAPPVEEARVTNPNRKLVEIVRHRTDRLEAKLDGGIRKLAQATVRPGVVVDYVILTTLTNHTFKGDTTYWVTNSVYLGGMTTIEGGTVVKFQKTNNAMITIGGGIICHTAPYRPAIFTGRDDNSVGETMPGSTGSPSGYYGSGLNLMSSTTHQLSHVRFSHLGRAIYFDTYSEDEVIIEHSQIVKCETAIICEGNVTIANNVLFNQVGKVFQPYEGVFRGQHLTVNQCDWLAYPIDAGGSSMHITNSLLIAVTNWSGNITWFTNSTASVSSGSGIFQTVGAGDHYLTLNSAYRNAGTSSISSELAQALKRKTTYAPTVISNVLISASTNLPIRALRDTDAVDLGYHYDSIDYAITDLTISNAVVVLSDGLSLAVFGDNGFKLKSGANLVSEGTARVLNNIVRYQAIQEQSLIWGANSMSKYLVRNDGYAATPPKASFRFTHLSVPSTSANGKNIFHDGGYAVSNLTLRDSHVHGGIIIIYPYNDTSRTSVAALTNNVFERAYFNAYNKDPIYNAKSTVYAYNNLFWQCSLLFSDNWGTYPSTSTWLIRDNVFDNTIAGTGGYSPANSYNGYVNSTALMGSSGNDQSVGSFTYQNGPLGRFYQQTTNFINRGSRNSTNSSLYHYTTQNKQTKEVATIVDLGFHYVALGPDSSGLMGHWRFDETAGTTTADSSPNQHHGGMVLGATWGTGVLGNAADLTITSTNDHVYVTNSTDFSFPNDNFTISLWVKPTGGGSAVIGKGLGGGGVSEYLVNINSAGFYYRGSWRASTALNVAGNTWAHVAITFENGALRFYRDGTYNNGISPTGSYPTDLSYGLYFGQQGAGTFNHMGGYLDEVRIYRRALSGQEIYWLANLADEDSDYDGIPDYLEDTNGNGVVDSTDGGNDTDGDGIANRLDARPWDPRVGAFAVTIDSPINGQTIQ